MGFIQGCFLCSFKLQAYFMPYLLNFLGGLKFSLCVTYANFNSFVPSNTQLPKNPIPTLMAETSKNTVPILGHYRPHAY